MSFQKSKTKSDSRKGPRSSRAVEDPTRPLQQRIYQLLEANELEQIDDIFHQNLEVFHTNTQKGLVSLILRYAIIRKNEDLIESLIPRLTMKRDYFNLILYNHPRKITYNIELFSHINIELLDSNDIKFIIDNGLIYLLPLLEGKFVKVNIPRTIDLTPELRFTPLTNVQTYIDKLLNELFNIQKTEAERNSEEVKQRILIKCQKELSIFVACIESKHYDIIIDGGNVLHSQRGTHEPQDLVEMVRLVKSLGLNPLVVIYPSHLKTYPALSQIADVCASPYNDLDDYYIILAYLINLQKGKVSHIVSNDEYQDHILKLNDGKNDNTDFAGHIRDDQIRYSNIRGSISLITRLKSHSNCVQIIDSIAYIPTDDGGFIRVKL
jgi:hypothetical protein